MRGSRRADKPQRPLARRIARRGLQVIALLFGLYVIAMIYFVAGRPNPTVDYLALINADVDAIAPADRAWPHYRAVLLDLPGRPLSEDTRRDPRPGEPGWDELESFLLEHGDRLAALRAAAAMPGLGLRAAHELDPDDLPLWPDRADQEPWPLKDSLYGVLLPHLGELRRVARLLALDARRAANAGDGATAVADLGAMLGVAAQAREIPCLINDLVGSATAVHACDTAGDLVARWPQSFDDDQLRALAEHLAGIDDLMGVRFDGERYGWRDVVQRIYTDDGSGDGRITMKGVHASTYLAPLDEAPPRGTRAAR